MKKTKFGVGFLAALATVLIMGSSSVVITQQNQYSVIRQFGRVVDVRTNPGISWKLPFFQQTEVIPNTMLIYDLPISDVITKDKKTMVADSFVLWKIDDPYKFIQNLNGRISVAQDRLSTNVYNAMKNVISSKTQTEVISGRDGALAQEIKDNVGDVMEEYGIELLAVETKHLDLPGDNKEAVYQRMISERNNIAASYTAEGESEATKIRSETDKEVQIMLSEAKAKAEVLQAEGEAEYMRILSAAYADQSRADFYSFVRALDAAKISLSGENKTLFLDKTSPLVSVFYNNGNG